MKASKLPEKLYFTIEEMAERWHCKESTVWHYIHEGMLRPSLKSTELEDLDLRLFDDLDGVMLGPIDYDANAWRKGDKNATWARDKNRMYQCKDLAHFVYFDARYVIAGTKFCVREQWADWEREWIETEEVDETKDWWITVLETLEGKEYALTERLPVRRNVPVEYSPKLVNVTQSYESPRITREERDRFESEHEMVDAPIRNNDEYTTPYIGVMRDAISEFFEPRHSVDAKSDEVESWIISRLEATGIEGSKRIASAMFTIIKPNDHNPKKRRG